ncbi:ABC transporter substrate-binding protein [Allorhizobium sp. BGMRC 0089]|uniref:ABC transporter substrate-binding protein n=1 Tax=Allorhizobium sonneratiae TaxID=2934936 RepID=UPI00203422E6|nr:ABC transporter substrate-binding protein [Allorhizobium sonneratiae]MCM2293138.1 ABC transporter substrate-binding protein [Allorhizobium sonneratiae]
MAMMTDRRAVLKSMAASLVFMGMGRTAASAATKMRFLWWGSKERNDRSYKAMAAYKALHPDVSIEGEGFGWDNYWTRLATQTAGGNAPDIIQMDYRYLFEYARRGTLLDLNPYMGKSLKIEDFGASNIDPGKVNGKLYGVNLGVNSTASMVNMAAFKEAGLDAPHTGITWEDYGDVCAKLTAAKKRRGFYGTQDGSVSEGILECWLQQHGKLLYTADGKIGYNEADITDFFKFWAHMRQIKACPPADVQALDQLTVETNLLTLNKVAVGFANSNQFIAFQGVVKEPLALSAYPETKGGKPGQYLKPSMLISVSATSANKDAAVDFINFLVEEKEGAMALGIERGIPASKKIRDMLTPTLSDEGKKILAYIDELSKHVCPLPPPPPNGAGENQLTLKRVAEEVGFGRLSPEQGAAKFVDQAASNLKRG